MSIPLRLDNLSTLHEISLDIGRLIATPRRIPVSSAAAESLVIDEGFIWDPTLVPYMIAPMDATASRRHNMVCFVGPARTGKTLALILGRWVYTVTCHPQDFAVMHSSKDLARDLSNREIFRIHRDSPAMRDAMTGHSRDDNTHDKRYKSGVIGLLVWPSDSQLASRTIPVMLLTDYDRWPREVGGRSPIVQAQKRTQTAGSLAMTVVESSPGTDVSKEYEIEPITYELGKPLSHGFPPTVSGVRANICEIYNGGTREWWYVPCQSCGEYYPQNASISRFAWGDHVDPLLAAQSAGTVCPWCGSIHPETTKQVENANGEWLAEGEVIDCNGVISGESRRGHTYPSYSIGGGAAAYQSRREIVAKYLQALQSAKDTGDESTLKGVVNDDIGAPHVSVYIAESRSAAPLKKRAEKTLIERTVPEGVWFLVAAIDVQKDRFVVQVMGYGPVRNRWIIDRYNIKHAKRGEGSIVAPAIYDEDWELLIPLIQKSYPLADGSGRSMRVAGVLSDGFGKEGVTEKAMAFYRRLPTELRPHFRFVKGEHKPGAPLIEQRWPDSRNRSDRKGATRGDVPILFLNSNRLKDRLSGDLDRDQQGAGYIHFPGWLGEWFFREITNEKRDKNGHWEGTGRNEAWDLMCYAEAGAILGLPFSISTRVRMRGIDSPGFWETPPDWVGGEWDRNPLIVGEKGPVVPVRPKQPQQNNSSPFISRPSGRRWIR